MIHHFYVGHFEKDKGVMKLEKRKSDGAPRPVVVRPLDMATVRELLEEKVGEGTNIPEDWWLGIDEEGFIVCDRHTHSRDAIDFIRRLATKTGCDILYDGMIAVSPDELTFAWDESNGAVEMERQNRETCLYSLLGRASELWPGTPFYSHLENTLSKIPTEVLEKLDNEA